MVHNVICTKFLWKGGNGVHVMNMYNLNIGRLVKVAFAILTVVILTQFAAITGAGNILSLLQSNGVKIVPGLPEALSTVSTVYGAQQVFLSFLGVTVAPWLAAAVVGVGAIGL